MAAMAGTTAMATDRAQTMRAAVRRRYGKPVDVLELTEVPRPELTDDGTLVRVHAVGLNRADWYQVTAPSILLRPMMGGVRRPKNAAVGSDFAGVVEAVGKDVTDLKPGDEVFGGRTGCFAEYTCVKNGVAKKPAQLSFEEASTFGVAGITALQALRDHCRVQPGQKVLVNGASGGVGVFAVQIAKALGAAEVDAVCRTQNVEQAHALGADRVFDYTQEDFTASGRRYDAIVDVAGSKSWSALRRVLEPEGRVAIVGGPFGGRLLGPIPGLARRWVASKLGSQTAVFFVAKMTREDMNVLRELAESGNLKPVIERTYTWNELPEALMAMGEGHVRSKLVVTL